MKKIFFCSGEKWVFDDLWRHLNCCIVSFTACTWADWALELNMWAIRRLVKIFCQGSKPVELCVWALTHQALTGVLQLFQRARSRLEVTGGTIRERRLPRVCQWNMRPDTSASSWLGLFLPLCSWEVWKGDTLMLTLLCPACHLTFMLDVSSPAAATQSSWPWHRTRRMRGWELWPRTWGRMGKSHRGGESCREPHPPLKCNNFRAYLYPPACVWLTEWHWLSRMNLKPWNKLISHPECLDLQPFKQRSPRW